MDIKGINKLNGLDSLNRRIYQDEAGWHFLIYNLPREISIMDKKAFSPDPEWVVVDLAQENDCRSADEVRFLYDEVMELFFDHKIQIRSNGVESVCPEVDIREFTLKLSSYQVEMLQEGLCSIGNNHTNMEWDPAKNPEYFALLDMFFLSKHDKKHIREIIGERRQEFLNFRAGRP